MGRATPLRSRPRAEWLARALRPEFMPVLLGLVVGLAVAFSGDFSPDADRSAVDRSAVESSAAESSGAESSVGRTATPRAGYASARSDGAVVDHPTGSPQGRPDPGLRLLRTAEAPSALLISEQHAVHVSTPRPLTDFRHPALARPFPGEGFTGSEVATRNRVGTGSVEATAQAATTAAASPDLPSVPGLGGGTAVVHPYGPVAPTDEERLASIDLHRDRLHALLGVYHNRIYSQVPLEAALPALVSFEHPAAVAALFELRAEAQRLRRLVRDRIEEKNQALIPPTQGIFGGKVPRRPISQDLIERLVGILTEHLATLTDMQHALEGAILMFESVPALSRALEEGVKTREDRWLARLLQHAGNSGKRALVPVLIELWPRCDLGAQRRLRAALAQITGENLPPSRGAWQDWWRRHEGFSGFPQDALVSGKERP